MGYPGSKGGAGVAERIISLMPAHDTYVEGFAGGAAVFRRKRRASSNWLIDKSYAAYLALTPAESPGVVVPGERQAVATALARVDRSSTEAALAAGLA